MHIFRYNSNCYNYLQLICYFLVIFLGIDISNIEPLFADQNKKTYCSYCKHGDFENNNANKRLTSYSEYWNAKLTKDEVFRKVYARFGIDLTQVQFHSFESEKEKVKNQYKEDNENLFQLEMRENRSLIPNYENDYENNDEYYNYDNKRMSHSSFQKTNFQETNIRNKQDWKDEIAGSKKRVRNKKNNTSDNDEEDNDEENEDEEEENNDEDEEEDNDNEENSSMPTPIIPTLFNPTNLGNQQLQQNQQQILPITTDINANINAQQPQLQQQLTQNNQLAFNQNLQTTNTGLQQAQQLALLSQQQKQQGINPAMESAIVNETIRYLKDIGIINEFDLSKLRSGMRIGTCIACPSDMGAQHVYPIGAQNG
ncbi:MAG: hypothetical protein IJ730_01215, partial [Alphaproteobacteria bacterium]|nr:hypothetical protein [Alphaproteobacteria bacterium]